jgi:hypothetical protein
MEAAFIEVIKKQFSYYKLLGDKTLQQVPVEQWFWQPNANSNSIALIIKHLHGNMLSRWTNFLTEDGEKAWRQRDEEFENKNEDSATIKKLWEEGWQCLFNAIAIVQPQDLSKVIYIRNMGLTVADAFVRQMAHYPYHVGQIVLLGKQLLDQNWESLSIAKGQSQQYNNQKFANEKQIKHFADDYIKPKNDEEK